MAKAKPKFINPADINVTVFNEDKRMLTVAPYRESNPGTHGAVYVVEGEHYAQFAVPGVGPLAPFQESGEAPQIDTTHESPPPPPKNYPRPDAPVPGVPTPEEVAANPAAVADQQDADAEALMADSTPPADEQEQDDALAAAFAGNDPGEDVVPGVDDVQHPDPQEAEAAQPNTPVTADHDAAIAAAFSDDEEDAGDPPASEDTTEEKPAPKPRKTVKRGGSLKSRKAK